MGLGFTQEGVKKEKHKIVVLWWKGITKVVIEILFVVLEKVLMLEHDSLKDRTSRRVVLFRCKWYDVFDDKRWLKNDKFGETHVNVTRNLKTNEPFAIASQTVQVFYVPTHYEHNGK